MTENTPDLAAELSASLREAIDRTAGPATGPELEASLWSATTAQAIAASIRAGQVSTKLGDAIARTAGAYTAAELEDGLAAARRGDELTDDETAAALIALAIETGRPLVVSDPAEMSDLEELDALADTALSNWEMAAATRDAARAELALAQMRVQRAEDAIFKATAEYDRACQRRDEARRADEGDPQMRAAAQEVTRRGTTDEARDPICLARIYFEGRPYTCTLTQAEHEADNGAPDEHEAWTTEGIARSWPTAEGDRWRRMVSQEN
jgi:hypothetical protein